MNKLFALALVFVRDFFAGFALSLVLGACGAVAVDGDVDREAPSPTVQYCQSGCWIDGWCTFEPEQPSCGTPACVACPEPADACQYIVCDGACGLADRPDGTPCEGGVCQAGRCEAP